MAPPSPPASRTRSRSTSTIRRCSLYEWSVTYSSNDATSQYICRHDGQPSGPGIPASRDDACLWQNPGPAPTQGTINVFAQSDDDAPIGTPPVAQVTIAPQPGGVVYPWQQVDVGAVAQPAAPATATASTPSMPAAPISGARADAFHFRLRPHRRHRFDVVGGHRPRRQRPERERVDQGRRDDPRRPVRQQPARVARSSARQGDRVPAPPHRGRRRASARPVPRVTAPVWLRLTMQRSRATRGDAFAPTTGRTTRIPWIFARPGHVPDGHADQPLLGLAVTSHADGDAGDGNVFSDVRASARSGTGTPSASAPMQSPQLHRRRIGNRRRGGRRGARLDAPAAHRNAFAGDWSTDGVSVAQVGSATVAMNEAAMIGGAATSHNTAATTTAVFDDVAIAQP